jgi:hypothetical protein
MDEQRLMKALRRMRNLLILLAISPILRQQMRAITGIG